MKVGYIKENFHRDFFTTYSVKTHRNFGYSKCLILLRLALQLLLNLSLFPNLSSLVSIS